MHNPPHSAHARSLVRRTLRVLAVAALALVSLPGSAAAGTNDITLGRFGECNVTANSRCFGVIVNEEAYRQLSRDLGLLTQPRNAAPAGTLGTAGFAFRIDHSFHTIDAQSEGWQLGRVTPSDDDLLHTSHFHVRKGLPFGFEIEGSVGHLWGSEMMTVGTGIKWSPLEDIYWPAPDLSFRGSVGTLLGVPTMNVTTIGADVLLGTRVGVGHVMTISPWAGYSLAAVVSSTRMLDADPEVRRPQTDAGASSYFSEFVFGTDTELVHRATLGLHFQFTVATLSFEAMLGDSDVQSYTLSLGAEF
ncbi:MAG: hypothetical protein EA398_14895 [Deltaproteobacteria bacterium]|nr:MAG: hypothetical protein EA398_14895 [Deltaproteobacteria bacterium]